ncbi:MAG: alpha/beta fold hydrolase [Actinomycetes bacterium]|jgi:carboxylesterase
MSTTNAPEGWLDDFASEGRGANASIGILLVHGFTGSPASMRPWAHFMNEHGYTVRVPRLPGHGRNWEDLNAVSWEEWPARVVQDLQALRATCSKVFVFGLSMGGGTTLNVAENNLVDGIVLVNPMIHIPGIQIKFAPLLAMVKKGMPSVGNDIKKPDVTEWGYDVLPTRGVLQLNKLLKSTRAHLAKVTAPTLLFHSVDDHVLPISNSDIIMSGISTANKQRIEMTNSYHVATLDYDADLIFANALAHVKEWS